MAPYLVIGNLHIPSYSLFVFIGVVAFTVTTILLLEKKEGIEQKITNRLLIISIFGLASLGIFAFAFNSLFHSIAEGRLVLGGITWLGGVVGAFPLMIFLIHKFCPMIKGEALKYFNLLVPGIVLAHGFGRIGCFFGGCCYGKVTDSIFGVSFPKDSNAALRYPGGPDGGSLPVLPTQLFEALFEFALFIVMLALFKKLKNHFFETYCLSYGIFRFLLELARGDKRGATGLFLSPSQVLSFILIVAGALLILYHKGKVFKKLHAKMDAYKENQAEYNAFAGDITNVLDTIEHLKNMADKGVITMEEYEKKKKKLLKKI